MSAREPATAGTYTEVEGRRERRGRPVLGGVSGFFFGLGLGISLLFTGVLALNSPLLTILPLVGVVLGALWGWWAPLGGRKGDEVTPAR